MTTITDAERPGGRGATAIDITFDNRGDKLIGLGAVNGLFKVISLGIYSFWAKTEIRSRIWSFVRLNGEPIEYTGTGKELLLGFLLVFGAFILPTILGGLAVALMFGENRSALAIYQGVVYVLFFILVGNAMYRAQRYRLSRTRWRGIRGGMAGSPAKYGWTYFWTLALPMAAVALAAGLAAWLTAPAVGGVIVVLGLAAALWVLPWRANTLQRHLTNDMRFGELPFSYTGTSGPLYKRYFFAWMGSALVMALAVILVATFLFRSGLIDNIENRIPPSPQQLLVPIAIVFGALVVGALITAWYRANQMRHFASHTHFDGATFRWDASGGSLMWLILSNWLISITAVVLGFMAGGLLLYAAGGIPVAQPGAPPPEPGILPIAIMLSSLVLVTSVSTAFTQFRAARYFLSRLKLDGPVDLSAILQSKAALSRSGEGLAQVFDLDAF